MAEESKERRKYPGPERFWRQSPELMGMQNELRELWDRLEEIPSFPEEKILLKSPGKIIAIKKQTDLYTDYKIFKLDSPPTISERDAAKPYHLRPWVPREGEDPQIMIDFQKWPSGYRIDGEPVTEVGGWDMFVHRGKAEFKDMPEWVRGEGIRLVALRLIKKDERLSEAKRQEGKRILNLVKSAVEKTK